MIESKEELKIWEMVKIKEHSDEDLKKYWDIAEVAEELGIATSKIRHWESVTLNYLRVNKTKEGWRRYDKAAKDRVAIVKHLKDALGISDKRLRVITTIGFAETLDKFLKEHKL